MSFFDMLLAQKLSGNGGGGGGGSAVDFSTTEQATGIKWIDGKDIYCITFDRSEQPVGSGGTLDVSTLKIETLVDAALTRGIANTDAQVSIGTGGCGVYVLNNSLVYYSGEGGVMLYCTIWYTKTSSGK